MQPYPYQPLQELRKSLSRNHRMCPCRSLFFLDFLGEHTPALDHLDKLTLH